MFSTRNPHFIYKDADRLKVKGWRKIYHANTSQKEAGVAIVSSDKLDSEGTLAGKRGILHTDKEVSSLRRLKSLMSVHLTEHQNT